MSKLFLVQVITAAQKSTCRHLIRANSATEIHEELTSAFNMQQTKSLLTSFGGTNPKYCTFTAETVIEAIKNDKLDGCTIELHEIDDPQ